MGYFSNGSAGEWYFEEYCSRCVHEGDDFEGPHCPIWTAHLLHNYEECNKPESILHMLIPRNGGCNEQCLMFIEKPVDHELPLPSTAARIKTPDDLRRWKEAQS